MKTEERSENCYHILLETLDEMWADVPEAMETRIPMPNPAASFESLARFEQFMFPLKFEILKTIKANKCLLLSDLAKKISHSEEQTHKECKDLELMGFVRRGKNPKSPMRLSFDYSFLKVHKKEGAFFLHYYL